MCQLLGISSQQPVNPRGLLAEFFQRGGATAEHADGWGVATYDEQENTQIIKSLSAASQCELAEKYLTSDLRSKHFIAHIRKATYGEIKLKNTHPFKRSFGDRIGCSRTMLIYMVISQSQIRYLNPKATPIVSGHFAICYPISPNTMLIIIPA